MSKGRFGGRVLPMGAAVLIAAGLLAPSAGPAQEPKTGPSQATRPDFIPADFDDFQNMLDQLGIKKMRRGRDSKVKDTSDEATANPWKDTLPDLMTLKGGAAVTADRWPERRAEIAEDFEREVYGRIPANVPKVKWEVIKTEEGASGGVDLVTRTLVGTVDNSAFPKIAVAIRASYTVPRHAAGQVRCRSSFSSAADSGSAPHRRRAARVDPAGAR